MNRKNLVLAGLLCISLFGMVSRVTGQANSTVPSWVNAIPPEGTRWGIGAGKLTTAQNSMNFAEFNAKMDLARQIVVAIRDAARDYSTPNQPDKFDWNDDEFIAQELCFEFSTDLKVVRRSTETDGSCWCLVELNTAGFTKYYGIGTKIIQKYK